MNIYLCASFTRILELRRYRDELHAMGHTVTSSWLDEDPDANEKRMTISTRTRLAMKDLEEIDAADALICFTEDEGGPSRGGRHVEYGYAWAKGKHLTVVGPRENIFHCLSHLQYDTWDDARESMDTSEQIGADHG